MLARPGGLKAHTHKPIFGGFLAESVVESAVSAVESADSSIDSVKVDQLSPSNMFNILRPLESADENWSTGNRLTGIGRRELADGKSVKWVRAFSTI